MYPSPHPAKALVTSQWEQIAIDSGYKNAASAKSTYSRLCKSPTDKGGGPLSGGPKTPSKVAKRTGKIGSASIKKPRGKKDTMAAAAPAAAEDDAAEKEQVEVKAELEDEDAADAMMSGAL